jgi:hypothetical protein
MIKHMPMKLYLLITTAVLGSLFTANSASPKEEARFLADVKSAFEQKDAKAFLKLYCWDRVPDSVRSVVEKTTPRLLELKVESIALVAASPELSKSEFVRDGVTYRPNLPITKQVEVAHSSAEKKMKGKAMIPVGEKDGKLYVTCTVPLK